MFFQCYTFLIPHFCVYVCVSCTCQRSVFFIYIYISGHQFDFGVISLVDEDLNEINGVKMAIKMPKGHLCTKKKMLNGG